MKTKKSNAAQAKALLEYSRALKNFNEVDNHLAFYQRLFEHAKARLIRAQNTLKAQSL